MFNTYETRNTIKGTTLLLSPLMSLNTFGNWLSGVLMFHQRTLNWNKVLGMFSFISGLGCKSPSVHSRALYWSFLCKFLLGKMCIVMHYTVNGWGELCRPSPVSNVESVRARLIADCREFTIQPKNSSQFHKLLENWSYLKLGRVTRSYLGQVQCILTSSNTEVTRPM